MTIRGKIRIYELSRDLDLDNKNVLDAAKKLSISVKSHSSSISEDEAKAIKSLLRKNQPNNSAKRGNPQAKKEILSVKKSDPQIKQIQKSEKKKSAAKSSEKPIKKEPQIQSLSPKPIEFTKAHSEKKQAKSISPKSTSQIQSNNALPSKRPLSKPILINPPQPKPPVSPSPQKVPSKATTQKQSENLNKKIQPNEKTKPPLNRKFKLDDKNKPQQNINKSEKAPKKVNPPELFGAPIRRERPLTNSNQKNLSSRPPFSSKAGAPQNGNNNSQRSPETPLRPSPPMRQARPGIPPNTNRPGGPQGRPGMPNRPGPGGQQGRPGMSNRPGPGGQQGRPGMPNRPGPGGQQGRPGMPNRPGPGGQQGRPGMPNRPGPGGQQGRPGMPGRAGRPGMPGRAGRPGSQNRPGGQQGRPGMPSGMRKPVAPGELMQLQKPSSRPGSPPPKKPDSTGTNANKPRRDNSSQKQPTNRPTAPTAPKKPFHRPGSNAPRKSRPDWDDSAKLEALRSKSNQKQRQQKVRIIGENDDALTTETSGFAGEQKTTLSSASLARPAKPKSTEKGSAKPKAAMRKRKKETTRQRQRRRAMELRASREAKQVRPEMIVVPEENLTVQELADKLSVESSEIIKSLFFKGITATVTQSLDLSTIETVAQEFGVPVLEDDIEEAAKKTVEMIEESDIEHLIKRPPVVTVMGHVDHGKTSLLDAIREARVAAGEAGGITQHIGAYQVEIKHEKKNRTLTFLDTPGHEAFTAMRARGTKVTDVAVLVVAADDGVRPQTLEAISHARAAEVPIVVAINKIDKEGSSPDRVKQELSDQNLISEEWGGDVVMVPVSAIKGENIDKLLEMILLVSEVEDLQANPKRLARGTVIEAHLDKAKGPVATLLVQNGTLKSGDVIAAGAVLGKIRAMVDENGTRLKLAGPSCPVEALGFNEVPTAGDEFEVYPDEKSARSVVGDRASDARATRLAQQMATRRVSLSGMSGQANEGDLKELNIILKADVQGSIEAILGSLEQLPKDEVQVRVLLSAPGEITETDIDLAAASGAVIVGFNTSMASGAKRAADSSGVDVRDYEVIYKLLEDIQLAMEGLLEPDLVEESLGEAEVRAIFTIGRSAVAGCYVTNGKLQRNCRVRVNRGSEIVYEGDLDSLRRNKDDVKDVATGFECGVGSDRFSNWKEGDRISAFKMVTQKRKLNN
tara:strand:- start:1178 stop:4747 length:3570 start_codon:yes stop_codon:yes gene_type:complete